MLIIIEKIGPRWAHLKDFQVKTYEDRLDKFPDVGVRFRRDPDRGRIDRKSHLDVAAADAVFDVTFGRQDAADSRLKLDRLKMNFPLKNSYIFFWGGRRKPSSNG